MPVAWISGWSHTLTERIQCGIRSGGVCAGHGTGSNVGRDPYLDLSTYIGGEANGDSVDPEGFYGPLEDDLLAIDLKAFFLYRGRNVAVGD